MFMTNENRQATLRGRKGLAGTKLGLDENLTPAQQARKSKMWLWGDFSSLYSRFYKVIMLESTNATNEGKIQMSF
jgi:hypothetical protein